MARIAWVEDADAQGPLAAIYAQIRATSERDVPEIYRTMSLRPDLLAAMISAAQVHFSDGALTRAQHEMIASYVAAINKCHYCLSGHARFLQLQGSEYEATAQALLAGNLDVAPVTPAERLLLEFVGTLTRHAYKITDEQVQALRDSGWNDPQIAEAVYVGALFNFFVRLADAFDIHPAPFMEPDGPPPAVTSLDPI